METLLEILKLDIMLFGVKKGWLNLKCDLFHHDLAEKLERYSKNVVKSAQENSNTVLNWLHMVNGLPSLCWVWIRFWGLYCVQCRKNSKQWNYCVGLTALLWYCQDIVLQLNEKFLTSGRNRWSLWPFRAKGLCS